MQKRELDSMSKRQKSSKVNTEDGLHHWLHQRLTALLLIPLSMWFVYFLSRIADKPFDIVLSIIKEPGTITGLVILICAVFYHAALGIQVIIEDYIHNIFWRNFLISTIRYIAICTVVAQISVLVYTLIYVY